MAVRRVLRYPHPALKDTARPLDLDDADRVRAVARDLVDTMRAHPGCVGLAAPQLGELVRIVAVDVSGHPKASGSHGLLLIVNPRITGCSGAEVAREGCLSIPDLTANVRRATRIAVEGSDLDGGGRVVESEGFEARCLQHELDHLDGILFLDRVDSLKTDVFRRKTYRPPPGPRSPG
jgi:peptide deformylase